MNLQFADSVCVHLEEVVALISCIAWSYLVAAAAVYLDRFPRLAPAELIVAAWMLKTLNWVLHQVLVLLLFKKKLFINSSDQL